MNIASYYASISFKVDQKDIQKVDRALSSIEKKLSKFKKNLSKVLGLEISKFSVNQKLLTKVLGDSLDLASKQVSFEVSRFTVNDRNLQASLTRAMRRVNPSVTPGPSKSKGFQPLSGEEWSRRQAVLAGAATLRHQRQLELANLRRSSSLTERSRPLSGRSSIGMGLMGPLGYGALALAGGGYGLGALNRRNQEVVSAQLQSQAVVQQAGGTAEQGQASFQYLRSEANRIGFNYLEASGDYNKLISGLTGSGFSVKDSQKVFSGFAELARVNKLDKTTQNRLFRALSQVAGKGKLTAEELTSQISEALPGGTALFARAYQAQLAAQGKGSGLTGQAAIEKLRADMQKGLVTSEILRYAGIDASTQANKGGALALASTASQAEQQRYQNSVSDLAVVASNSGIEEGFARIFRTLNAGLGEANGLVEGLAEGFNEATKWADDLLLFPQSFVRMLEGKDSLVADWLGYDTSRQLVEDWKQVKELWSQISAIKVEDIFGDFLPNLESTSRELAAILNTIKGIKDLKDGNLPTQKTEVGDIPQIDPFGTGAYPSPVGVLKAGYNNFLVGINNRQQRNQALYDPNSIYYNDPTGYDQMEADRQQYSVDRPAQDLSRYKPQSKAEIDDFNTQQRLAALEDAKIVNQATTNNDITIQLNIDPITLAQMDITNQADQLTQAIALNLQSVLVQFPNKE